MAENEGDKAQLERFYKACARGIRQVPHALVIRRLQDVLSEVVYRCAWYGLMTTWATASQFLRRKLIQRGWVVFKAPVVLCEDSFLVMADWLLLLGF
jgi:hypothetical protein